jgi:hypothetical protein
VIHVAMSKRSDIPTEDGHVHSFGYLEVILSQGDASTDLRTVSSI